MFLTVFFTHYIVFPDSAQEMNPKTRHWRLPDMHSNKRKACHTAVLSAAITSPSSFYCYLSFSHAYMGFCTQRFPPLISNATPLI